MSVVSDTTAITTLLKAERCALLQEMFGQVLVPQAVWDELTEFHSQLPEFVQLRLARKAEGRLPEIELARSRRNANLRMNSTGQNQLGKTA